MTTKTSRRRVPAADRAALAENAAALAAPGPQTNRRSTSAEWNLVRALEHDVTPIEEGRRYSSIWLTRESEGAERWK